MIKFNGKRVISAAAAAALAASSIVALGTPAQAAETITFWGATAAQGGKNQFQNVADAFNASQTKYKVEFQAKGAAGDYGTALSAAAQANALPDVFMVQPGIGSTLSLLPFARAGQLATITGSAAAKANPASEKLLLSVGKNHYGTVFDMSPGGAVVNTSLLKKDGLAWPTTYSGLLSLCSAAKAKGKSLFTIAGSNSSNNGLMALNMIATNVYGADPSWNLKREQGKVKFATSASWKRTLNQVVEMNKAGCFQDAPQAGSFGTINGNISSGKSYAAFVPGGIALTWSKQYNSTFHVYPMPVADKASSQRVMYGSSYAAVINKKTKQLAGARAFLDFIASSKGQNAYQSITGGLANNGDFDASKTPHFSKVAEFLIAKKTTPPANNSFPQAQTYVKMGEGIQALFTGQATVDQVLSSMDSTWR